nr:hypothetical protein [Tanacetum cinerariifolium]
VHGEKRVEVRHEAFVAAHFGDEAGRVVGHVEAVVPGVALDVAGVAGGQHVKLLAERAVGQARAHEADARIVYVLP